jgi:alpha-beta hydrolase superfamily lysophospholipase
MVALSAPLALKMNVPWWKRELSKKFHGVLPILTVDNCMKPEYLSSDMLEVETRLADSLCHNKLSIRAGHEIMKNLEQLGGLPAHIHVPTLMLAGSKDQVCESKASIWFTAGLAAEDKKCHVYQGMHHDLLHDIGKEKVMDDVVDWIMARTNKVGHTGDQYPLNQREALWENVSQPVR